MDERVTETLHEAAARFTPLLLAGAGAVCDAGAWRPLRARLLERVGRSAQAARAMHTVRHADTMPARVARGVVQRALYRSAARDRASGALRPGEPLAVDLVELAAGTRCDGPAASTQREWLVLHGAVQIGGRMLRAGDFHLVPAGLDSGAITCERGARVYQRAGAPLGIPLRPHTQHDHADVWREHGPGIHRRVLWQHEGEAALLYRAAPGAAVPAHGHRRDEECLMIEGDLFLDEVLLGPLDYQLAPAGTGHGTTCTDRGGVLFARGDLDLDLRPA